MFDWEQFFNAHGIEYVTSGPNIGRGELGVRCPFCGAADPSQHMSVNLEGHGWVCRRNRAEHRGKSAARLVAALLGCSIGEAKRMVGEPTLPGAATALAEVEALLGPQVEQDEGAPRALDELREFKKFGSLPSARPYVRYMVGRGFSEKFLRRASAEMGLRYCTRGPFGGRVVFLVHQGGALVNWTGRAISSRAFLRYRSLSPDPGRAARDGLPPAARPIEQCLLWADTLMAGGPLLEIVEGPMDALKMRMLGRRATCLFTNTPSRWQIDLLREISQRFERRVVLLDRGAEVQALRAATALAALGFRVGWLPRGVDDPGELGPSDLAALAY